MTFRHDDSPRGATPCDKSLPGPSPQVLVVEDVREIRHVMAAALSSSGYRVIEAEDGLAAQLILLSEHPSLVVSDLEMPIGDGWALLAFCHARHPEIPVLIVSGSRWGKRPEIECWAADFLSKPFTLDQFHATIRRLLSRAA